MTAFAANSVLCRVALESTSIDPASFSATRISSAAAALWLLSLKGSKRSAGSWRSAIALFVYVAAFSFSYADLPTGIGALLLFATVQVTMVGGGFLHGERLSRLQGLGVFIALAGATALLAPREGALSVSLTGAGLMIVAGVGWGIYSMRGRGTSNPAAATRDNFMLAVPLAAALLALSPPVTLDPAGLTLAVISGALTSGMGYIVWYSVVPCLSAVRAATVQLSVPVLAAAFGFILLGEYLTAQQLIGAIAIFLGIALTMRA